MVRRGASAHMKQWGLIIDVARCTNCQNCVLATKDEYIGNTFLPDFPGCPPVPES
jgi:Fe-S-cluster-containing dehydrogenase component